MATFGPYDVLQTVAVGSTGTIYRARHREIGQIAAIKELSEQLRAVPGLLDRFRSEAQTLASLDDEHVVAVFDFVEEPDRVWIAEEWVDGVTIGALLVAAGHLSAEQSLGVLRGALLGLAHAHDRNLVHRDFSPANILADQAGTSKLVDFGLAAPVGGTGVCGTPAYMSPEAVRGEPVSKSSDVYSAAAVLYTMLSGRLPFPAASVDAVFRAQVEQPPPVLAGHGPAMAELVTAAMAKDPAARPADARAFLDRLDEAAQQRYGAGWLERASIAGMVSAATAGGAAVIAGSSVGAASSAAGSAATVFVDAKAATGTAASVGRGISRNSRRWLVGVGTVAVVGAGVLVAATALSGNGADKKDPGKQAAANIDIATPALATSPAPTATIPPPLRDRTPTGKYRATVVITSTNIEGEKVGPSAPTTWTINLNCGAASCTGSVKSTSGKVFTISFDGTWLTATYRSTDRGPCVYIDGPQKGQQQAGTEAAVTFVLTLKARVTQRGPQGSSAAGVPLRLVGTEAGTSSAKILKVPAGETCTADAPTHDKGTFTLVQIG